MLINIGQAKDEFYTLISKVPRKGIGDLVEYLEDNGFFEAPCSTQYHLCQTGGLVIHSVNVTKLMLDIYEKSELIKDVKIPTESIVLVGLFHDVGKANYFNQPNYIDNILKSGSRSSSKPYTNNPERINIPHEVASIHILSKFIRLTEDETFAIYYHNGLYSSTGYSLKGNERPLQQLLHFADMWASRFIEVDEPIGVSEIMF